jgi:predicted nucleotide-binding protein
VTTKIHSDVFIGLAKFLLNGANNEGVWGSEPGTKRESSPLNTAEALCGLISIRSQLLLFNKLPKDFNASLEKAINYLFKTQLVSGGWATASDYRDLTITPKGNSVSTCFALWALLLSDAHIAENKKTVDVAINVNRFLESCKSSDGLYRYCPDIDKTSPVSTSYAFLSYALILSHQWVLNKPPDDLFVYVKNNISELLEVLSDNNFIEQAENDFMASIFIYLSIIFLENTSVLAGAYSQLEKEYRTIINRMSVNDCTTTRTEQQVVSEKDKTPRDFIHYIPIWTLIIYTLGDNSSGIQQYDEVLEVVRDNIEPNFNGVKPGQTHKRHIWATGITLLALSFFAGCQARRLLNNQNKIPEMDTETATRKKDKTLKKKQVFLVHGRDKEFKNEIEEFLIHLSLKPLDWEEVVSQTGKPTPTTHEVILKGFELAQAIVVLMTGDDDGKLKDKFLTNNDDELERQLSPQPRLNVVYEAGLAFGMHSDRTIFVKRPGPIRKITDVDGFNYVNYDNKPDSRKALATRLETANCSIIEKSSYV